MTLQQLKYFLEVAATQSFTAAANNLYSAQSSLSHAIHELERELGVPLFARNVNRKVELTEYGHTFRPYAESIFNTLSEGESQLKALSNPLTGTVKLGFCYCYTNSDIPGVLRRFYDDNPDADINIEFTVDSGHVKIDEEMQLGRYDLLVTTSKTVEGCDGTVISGQRLKLFVPNDHPIAAKERVTLKELEGETLIGISPGGNLDTLIKEMYTANSMKPDIMYCPDWLTQFGYVALRYGFAISSGMPVYKDYIKEIELDDPRVVRNLYMFWPNNRKLSRATAFVRDYIIRLTSFGEAFDHTRI